MSEIGEALYNKKSKLVVNLESCETAPLGEPNIGEKEKRDQTISTTSAGRENDVSWCDVSVISSSNNNIRHDDVSTLAPSESFESVTMSTVSLAISGVTSTGQQQQLSPRIRSGRPWTATGSCGSSTHSSQLAATAADSTVGSRLNGTAAESSRSDGDALLTLTLVESLGREVEQLKAELAASKATICRMNEREKKLRDRLSEQAQRQLEKGTTKFEDISLGDNRPTQLIKRYGNLYSESRLEAMDSLDELDEMIDCDDLKTKLLLSVVVLAFRSSQRTLEEVRLKVRDLLYIPASLESTASQHRLAARELDETIAVYLRKTVDRHDITSNYQEVCDRVWSTLFDYPSLRQCRGLLHYIKECVQLSWALTVQNPPLVIDYESKTFDPDLHTRFHTSDSESDTIRAVLWPILTEGEGGNCVFKGVVCT